MVAVSSVVLLPICPVFTRLGLVFVDDVLFFHVVADRAPPGVSCLCGGPMWTIGVCVGLLARWCGRRLALGSLSQRGFSCDALFRVGC